MSHSRLSYTITYNVYDAVVHSYVVQVKVSIPWKFVYFSLGCQQLDQQCVHILRFFSRGDAYPRHENPDTKRNMTQSHCITYQ